MYLIQGEAFPHPYCGEFGIRNTKGTRIENAKIKVPGHFNTP